MRRSTVVIAPRGAFALALAVCIAACGGGNADSPSDPSSVQAPTTVVVAPGDGQVSVTWAPVAGASAYSVYYGDSPEITTSSARVSGSGTTQFVPGTNGAPLWVAVATEIAGRQSALSSVVCGVPSAGGAPGPGLVLYDSLCSTSLDGSRYSTPEGSRRIQNGALELRVSGSNVESSSVRGVRPKTALVAVGSGAASRVTAWQATIAVPSAATAIRSGSAAVQAQISLQYQPIANRLGFPAGLAKNIYAHIGLEDAGSGLRFARSIAMCSTPSCSSDSATGVVFADGTFPAGQAASYGAAYTFSLAFDEAAGVFTYSVSGGGLEGVRTGTADASALFNAAGVTPNDFYLAELRTRVVDPGSGAGGGTLLATFDDVHRGVNGGPAAPFDSFDGARIDSAKWTASDASLSMNGGAVELASGVTSTTTAAPSSAVVLTPTSLPAAANEIRIDVKIAEDVAAPGAQNRFVLSRALYNDGTPGGGPNSALGDVRGLIHLSSSSATFMLLRSTTASGTTLTAVSSQDNTLPQSPTRPLGVGTSHTLRMRWDPSMRLVTFQLDDAAPVTVDPAAAGPLVASPARVAEATPHAPLTTFAATSSVNPGAASGTSAGGRFRLNNVFTAP
jgi:hypothetical protein